MWIVWAIPGALSAVIAEGLMRSGYGWRENIVPYVLLSTAVSYCVYRLLTGSTTGWLPGIVAFGAMTITMRIIAAFTILHEPVTPINVISAMVLAGVTAANVWYTLSHGGAR